MKADFKSQMSALTTKKLVIYHFQFLMSPAGFELKKQQKNFFTSADVICMHQATMKLECSLLKIYCSQTKIEIDPT